MGQGWRFAKSPLCMTINARPHPMDALSVIDELRSGSANAMATRPVTSYIMANTKPKER
jgi:hypothetical protein